ncbi:hypothetical protein FLP41_08190 [Paracoccus marcusii]|uniref:hypothetical protein n=1 Tax=Paracoccus marcusii TaxID=59779 RepID=UPI002ED5AB34|nr:hypothetical protein FLP41_08190 [Paracoccus marcusii]
MIAFGALPGLSVVLSGDDGFEDRVRQRAHGWCCPHRDLWDASRRTRRGTMNVELNALRARYGRMLVTLFWAHVPVIGLAAAWVGSMSPLTAMALAGAGRALSPAVEAAPHRPVTRNIAAVALVGEPALFLLVFEGTPGRWTCTCTSMPCWR